MNELRESLENKKLMSESYKSAKLRYAIPSSCAAAQLQDGFKTLSIIIMPNPMANKSGEKK